MNIALSLFGLPGLVSFIFMGDLQQPVAKKVRHVDTYHGQKVEDPYLWLEDMETDETRKWVLGQDAYARQYFKAYQGRNWIASRLDEIGKLVRFTNATRAGDRYFYAEQRPGIGMGNIWSRTKRGETKVVFNRKQLPDHHDLRGVIFSPDGDAMAYTVTRQGTRWGEIHIRNVKTGKDFEEKLSGFHSSFTSISWVRDGSGFFYNRVETPTEGEELKTDPKPLGIFYHRLGQDQKKDERVFHVSDHADWFFSHRVTSDGKYHVLVGRNQDTRKVYVSETGKRTYHPLFEAESTLGYLGDFKGELFFSTKDGAERGRVIAHSLDGEKKSRTIVPEGKDTLLGGTMEDGIMVLTYRKHAMPVLRAFRADGSEPFSIELPLIASPGVSAGQPGDGEMLVSLANLTDPGSLWKLSLKDGAMTRFLTPKTYHDPDRFITRQVFYTSKDGTRVPMFLVHGKNVKQNGKNPLLMYGFGSGNWAAFPWYQAHLVVWLEMGGVYAMPNVRGGGEYGQDWHQAGIKHNKQNSIDDFIYAARWLIDQKYTSSERLIINGGSASGPLAGAALVQTPELFAGALIEWPAMDMLRFVKYPGGRFWTWGNGSPENSEDFEILRSWSPYHNLKAGTCYPPTLLVVGEKDQGTIPAHAYKFQAAIQDAATCDSPMLMRMIWSGRHYQYGIDPADNRKTLTDVLCFLARTVSVEPPQLAQH